MSNPVKRQHFVPRTYLKHFSEPRKNEYFVCAKKCDDIKNSFMVNIKNVCLRKHLYTLDFPNVNEEDMMLLENFYCEHLESDYNKVFELLTNDNVRIVSPEQKTKIIETIISMYYRVAKWLGKSKEHQRDLIRELISTSRSLQRPEITLPTGKTFNLKESSEVEILAELEPGRRLNFILNQLEAVNVAASQFSNYNISVHKTFGDHEYLTSDVPIVLNNGKPELAEYLDESCHIMLSLSPKYCLILMPDIGNNELTINRVDMSETASLMNCIIINDHQFRNSENFVLGSKSGIAFFEKCQEISESKEKFTELQNKAEAELVTMREEIAKFEDNK